VPTNQELLEAAAFHRRRLVAVLLSGSPYDESPRLLRAVTTGGLLALVAVAAVLVADYLGMSP